MFNAAVIAFSAADPWVAAPPAGGQARRLTRAYYDLSLPAASPILWRMQDDHRHLLVQVFRSVGLHLIGEPVRRHAGGGRRVRRLAPAVKRVRWDRWSTAHFGQTTVPTTAPAP